MNRSTCSCIELNDGAKLYYLVEQSGSIWNFIFTNFQEAWSGEIKAEELNSSSFSEQEDCQKLFLKAFKLTSSLENFQYKIEKAGNGGSSLTWSSVLSGDQLTVRLGSISLVPSGEGMECLCSDMFDKLLELNAASTAKCKELSAQLEDEKKTSNKALEKLEEIVKVQVEAEKVLYTNFVAVLNEKKRKIRELTDQCNALQKDLKSHEVDDISHQAATDNHQQASKSKKNTTSKARKTVSACKKPKRKVQSKASTLSYDSETEEDDVVEATSAKRTKPLSQTDDDVTEVDEIEESWKEASTNGSQAQDVKKSNAQDTKIGDSQVASSSQSPTKIKAQSSSTLSASQHLDDLLGDTSSSARKSVSPIKRRTRSQLPTRKNEQEKTTSHSTRNRTTKHKNAKSADTSQSLTDNFDDIDEFLDKL